MAQILKKTGTEGTFYDPYSYEEYTFISTDGKKKAKIHLGLVVWVEVNGERLDLRTEEERVDRFEKETGLTVSQIERIYERLQHPKRCPNCGSKKRDYASGFPGETLELCGKCETVINCHFSESAII